MHGKNEGMLRQMNEIEEIKSQAEKGEKRPES